MNMTKRIRVCLTVQLNVRQQLHCTPRLRVVSRRYRALTDRRWRREAPRAAALDDLESRAGGRRALRRRRRAVDEGAVAVTIGRRARALAHHHLLLALASLALVLAVLKHAGK